MLPLVLLAGLCLAVFLWWKKLGCSSCCCLDCLKPRGLSPCGACETCPYLVEGALLRCEIDQNGNYCRLLFVFILQEREEVWLLAWPQGDEISFLQSNLSVRRHCVLHSLCKVRITCVFLRYQWLHGRQSHLSLEVFRTHEVFFCPNVRTETRGQGRARQILTHTARNKIVFFKSQFQSRFENLPRKISVSIKIQDIQN